MYLFSLGSNMFSQQSHYLFSLSIHSNNERSHEPNTYRSYYSTNKKKTSNGIIIKKKLEMKKIYHRFVHRIFITIKTDTVEQGHRYIIIIRTHQTGTAT